MLRDGSAPELVPQFRGAAAARRQTQELQSFITRLDGLLALAAGPAAGRASAGASRGPGPVIRQDCARICTISNRSCKRCRPGGGGGRELVVLPRYLRAAACSCCLVTELAELNERALRALQLEPIALVLDTDDDQVIATLREALRTVLGERFELVAAGVESQAVGASSCSRP